MSSRDTPKGIYETKWGTYQAVVKYQGKNVTVGSFDNVKDAEKALTIAKGKIASETFIPPSITRKKKKAHKEREAKAGIVLDDVAEQWLEWMQRYRKIGTIYTHRRRYVAHIQHELGDKPVISLTPKDIDDWYENLVRTTSKGVPRPVYMTLSALMSWCAGKAPGQSRGFEPLITDSPCQIPNGNTYTSVREESDFVASADQIHGLADLIAEAFKLPALLCGFNALRNGEVLALQRCDFEDDDENLWLSVRRQVQARGQGGLYNDTPKSTAGRRDIPVHEEIIDQVRDHLETIDEGPNALLFPRSTAQKTITLTQNSFRTAFNAAKREWNRKNPKKQFPADFHIHDLRHTALTEMGRNGATSKELMVFAGHDDPEAMMRYQHATRKRLSSLVKIRRDNKK